MVPGAAPAPLLRQGAKPCPDGILLDVSCSQKKMRIIHGKGSIPALPKVPCPALPSVDQPGVPAMHLAKSPRQVSGIPRDCDDVNMVGHEAVCPDINTTQACKLQKNGKIGGVVRFVEEYFLPPVATLRDMMRNVRQYNACYPRHWVNLSSTMITSILMIRESALQGTPNSIIHV